MEAIIKTKHKEAHALIDGFLQRHLIKHNGVYEGDLYKYFCADFADEQIKTRQVLVNILLKEQGGRCCYCMRRIEVLPAEDKSIEHIIVNHHIDANDYNQYLGHNSQLDSSYIIPSTDFIAKQTPPPPYPHSIAYENMLISCAGRCHLGLRTPFTCNNHRGHKFIKPLPLMVNIRDEVKYKKNGFVYWSKETDTTNPTIEVLGLNYDVLKLIRRLWYKLSSMGLNAVNCNIQELAYNVLGDMLDEGENEASIQLLFLFTNNKWYWELLLQFDYFNDSSKFE